MFGSPASLILNGRFFHRQKKEPIKLPDVEMLKREWLASRPKLIRHDFNLINRTEAPEILKYFGIDIKNPQSPWWQFTVPCYNAYNINVCSCELRDAPPGLIGVWFKPRCNPFAVEYPSDPNKHTLEGLLKYEVAIEEAFVFWDVNKIVLPNDVNIKIIEDYCRPNEQRTAIRRLLTRGGLKTNMTNKILNPGCYNPTPNCGLVCPLPKAKYKGRNVTAIYFDNGIRVLAPNHHYTIEDLLKLSNGAKNIWVICIKELHEIKLTTTLALTDALSLWKKQNNLEAFVGSTTYERDYKRNANPEIYQTKLLNTLTTGDKDYRITCQGSEITEQDIKAVTQEHQNRQAAKMNATREESNYNQQMNQYNQNYNQWKNDCLIKAGVYYSFFDVRGKFGRSSRDIYDETGRSCRYYYESRYWWEGDVVQVDGRNCGQSFNLSYHTSPPPSKPTKPTNPTIDLKAPIIINEPYPGTSKVKTKIEYNPQTGEIIKTRFFDDDGVRIPPMTTESKANVLTKAITYQDDGETVWYIEEYDQETGKMTKYTCFRDDGEKLKFITEHDKETGNRIKATYYNSDGTVSYINEYNKETGKYIKGTYYQPDGTIKEIKNY